MGSAAATRNPALQTEWGAAGVAELGNTATPSVRLRESRSPVIWVIRGRSLLYLVRAAVQIRASCERHVLFGVAPVNALTVRYGRPPQCWVAHCPIETRAPVVTTGPTVLLNSNGLRGDPIRNDETRVADGRAGNMSMRGSVYETRNLIAMLATERAGLDWYDIETTTKEVDQSRRHHSRIHRFKLYRPASRRTEFPSMLHGIPGGHRPEALHMSRTRLSDDPAEPGFGQTGQDRAGCEPCVRTPANSRIDWGKPIPAYPLAGATSTGRQPSRVSAQPRRAPAERTGNPRSRMTVSTLDSHPS